MKTEDLWIANFHPACPCRTHSYTRNSIRRFACMCIYTAMCKVLHLNPSGGELQVSTGGRLEAQFISFTMNSKTLQIISITEGREML